MDKKELLEDRIDAYLLDKMTSDERRQLEIDASNFEEIKKELEFSSNVQKALFSRTQKLIAIKEWEKKEKNKQKMKIAPYRNLYWISGIAAAFIVGIFIYISLPSPSSGDIAKESSNQPIFSSSAKDGDMSFRGCSQMDTESLLAMGDYSKALAQIEKDEANVRTELMLIDRQMSSREVSPDSVRVQQKKNKLVHLLYLKAKVLIALNRTDEAVKLLDEIRHSDSKYYREQADSLYSELRKRR